MALPFRHALMLSIACALGGIGCAADGTYCQSGPKYGTQCYGTYPSGAPSMQPPPPRPGDTNPPFPK